AVAVGHISLGNLRDAISSNELKMPDLQTPQLWAEDQLLSVDRRLAISLDGVYRRGEIYMRFLQKLSSVFFGTRLGRLLCLYLLLPALGSFTVIEGLQHMVGPVSAKLFGVHPVISTPLTLVAGAAFVFLLLHVGVVRRVTLTLVRALGTGLRFVLWTAPRAIWALPIVRYVMTSRVGRFVIRPGIPTAIAAAFGTGWLRWPVAGGVFVLFQIILNARVGQLGQEVLGDWAVRSGRHLSQRVIPGAVRLLLDFFAKLIELVDRAIYRVDGYLRFRKGQSVIVIAVKGALGLVWFVITYLVRIYINMFIEPVVNPVKHFPVVTVAGKIMLPLFPAMLSGMTGFLEPFVGLALARSLAGFTVFVFPGLAGFLVWELKANWFLYRATRARTLAPTVFGSHGETMVGLMKPGFHSGTIPKLFAKLRRATWKADERSIAKQEQGLHHVEEGLWKFVDRELVSLLNESQSFKTTDVAVKHVTIASNRIQVELACPSVDARVAMITLEQQSGWLVAGISDPGWIDHLDDHQRRIFEIALAGFYKLAAVDLVREQLEVVLGGRSIAYDISGEGLVAWPGDGYQTEVIYDLHSPGKATVRGPSLAVQPPRFDDRRALYHRESMPWSTWAATWEQLAAGQSPPRIVVGPELLPPRSQAASGGVRHAS
ncbi:MAG: hypothetical protein H0T79_09695, partial [Deltaproteobacteria bacterium]|nr:hypothetical protein [Deltaproteobacteria bacterium]